MMDWQTIAALITVAVAMVLLIRRFIRSLTSPGTGCHGCTQCSQNPDNLVQLSDPLR